MAWRTVGFRIDPPTEDLGLAAADRAVSVRALGVTRLEQDCYEAYNIQVSGLAQRLRATGIQRLSFGVSGGLDSTQALIVCAQAFDCWGCANRYHAYTMPGFATSDHTKNNAFGTDAVVGYNVFRAGYPAGRVADAEGYRHPFFGRKNQCMTSRLRSAGRLRTDFLFVWRTRITGSDRHRGFVRTGARLVHVWRRRFKWRITTSTRACRKTLIQHLIR